MRLEIITPERISLDRPVRRILAEAPDGHFGMLPHHGDFVTELVPGILRYEPEEGGERFVAVHSGTLVKCGPHVRVAVRRAIEGSDLTWLRQRVETEFRELDELEREARTALARLEHNMFKRFRDLEGPGS
ncbi:F0F1 ATP synthase subunit epsilon [Jannaschia seohaensis]|uniref:ATP synthase epsilon chain n=1 Tax=Jannaschia seohaensis TaxID=475081 RepID=A0A2Y9B8X1_9RHOB|nr:F0F1 ATP synthase subunit epsilon [Jannaschia seohaensis]PWJ09784.1 F-type H+-transporting ATPase subunit epsilon [Jannaschia seohaensis]SSA51938.1 F-type H+-transporting ATPase subunit epsilon [Jannaschia seohaensis]